MASIPQQAKITGYATFLPGAVERAEKFQAIFEEHRHRLYALAFWMTDNELAAEELMRLAFCRAFALHSSEPGAETLDGALLSELRELMPIGALSLEEGVCTEAPSVRRNTLRVHLERAVVQLPPTERLIFLLHDVENYAHARIAGTLGISEEESLLGLHQARLRMRNLVSKMAR